MTTKPKQSVSPLTVIAVGIAAAVVVLAFMLADMLRWPLIVAAWSGVVLGCVWGVAGLWRFVTTTNEAEERLQAENERTRAEAAEIRRRSEVTAIIADAGQQVYLSDTAGAHWRAGHVDPRPYANGPGGPAPTPEEVARWLAWLQGHATAKSGGVTVEAPQQLEAGEARPPDLVPALDRAQRLLIVGASDSGKSTLLKWLIQARLDNSQVIIIDPHSPSRVLGVDVIGAGRDYAAIEAALESLLFLMTDRYEQVAAGDVVRFEEFERVTVVIDEWTGIAANVDGAGDMLTQLLVESRKARIHFVVATHSDDVRTMGMQGRGQLRNSFTVCRLYGGNGERRRAFIDPAHKTGPDGKRLEPAEYGLPGPFAGHPVVPAGQLVIDLPVAPTEEERRVIDLVQAGASNYAICKELGWRRGASSYGRIEEIKGRFCGVPE